MNIFFLSEKDNDMRLQYVIGFIMGILGYPYETGKNQGKTGNAPLSVLYSSGDVKPSGRDSTVVQIFNSGLLNDLEQLEKTVNLFEWRGRSLPILGPQMPDDQLKGWRFNRVTGIYSRDNGRRMLISFDLYANIFYHLSRYEEKWRHFAEETITDHSTSVLARHQSLDDPLVDALVAFLDVIVRKSMNPFIRLLPWPGGQPFAMAFTHDVDLTRGARLKKRIVHRGLDLISKIGARPESASDLKKEIDDEDAQVWTFPQLLALYKQYDCRASFYFLVKMFEGMHFRYNISSRKFKNLIEEIQAADHEIGLHSSLKAFDKSGKYAEERQTLENVAGTHTIGLRQHYLRAKFPRLWQLAADAGFGYDTSLGYNYQYGFRAGTSHPFQCYNFKSDQKLDLWEFSLTFFEHNLPGDPENPEELIAVVGKIIGKVEQYEGLVVGLLHPSNFLKPNYNRLWEWFLDQVEKRGAFSSTLTGIMAWLTDRQQIKIQSTGKGEITISKPPSVSTFSVETSEKTSIEPVGKCQVKPMSGNRYRITATGRSVKLRFV